MKGQIDIALTIGAIIIPAVALLSALIFAFSILGPLTDAARLAAVISHDVVTLVDIAYSVPDDIIIHYKPSSVCEFQTTGLVNNLVCLKGFMNISTFKLFREYKETKTIFGDKSSFPYYSKAHLPAMVSKEYFDNPPLIVEYMGFNSLKDHGYTNLVDFRVDKNAIVISKTRTALYDTINAISDKTDILYKIVDLAHTSCVDGTDYSTLFSMPPLYYLNNSGDGISGNVIELKRVAQSPNNVADSSPIYQKDFLVYSFNFLRLTSLESSCNYFFEGADMNTRSTYLKQNSVQINTTVTCVDSNCNVANCLTTCIPPSKFDVTINWTVVS